MLRRNWREGNKESSRKGALKISSAEKRQNLDWRNIWNEGTDAVMDVPLGGVCEVLYGSGKDEEEEDKLEDT